MHRYGISKHIEELTEGDVSIGTATMYTMLKKMQAQDYITLVGEETRIKEENKILKLHVVDIVAQKNAKLKQEIQTIYDESKGIYGSPKIHKIIYKKFYISLKRVQKNMKELGLRSIIIKKFKHNTTKVDIVEKDNALGRDFSTSTINEKWVGDITYVHTIKYGWYYLLYIKDLHTRKIVEYSFVKSITTD